MQVQLDLTQPDDNEGSNWGSGIIQVDAELSKKYGRTIRNGNNYRLVGYGATLRSKQGRDEVDTGFATTVGIQYCPTTKHSVDAWNMMYRQWLKQKKLKSAAGQFVRYDDLELGWTKDDFLPTGRNSTIAMGGISDNFEEKIVVYGESIDGVNVSLEQYWENMRPIPPASETAYGVIIKEPKFDNVFPERMTLYCSSTFSSMVDTSSLPDSLGGALATSEINWLPTDNHLNHMTGTLYYYVKGLPIDTGAQLPDELTVIVTLVYEGWNPLVDRPKRKLTKGKTHGKPKRARRSRSKK